MVMAVFAVATCICEAIVVIVIVIVVVTVVVKYVVAVFFFFFIQGDSHSNIRHRGSSKMKSTLATRSSAETGEITDKNSMKL